MANLSSNSTNDLREGSRRKYFTESRARRVYEILAKDTTIELNLPDPTASEDLTLFYTPTALSIAKLEGLVNGNTSPSVTWTIRFASDRSAVGTEAVTGGVTSNDSGSSTETMTVHEIPSGSWVWLETTAKTGDVMGLRIRIQTWETTNHLIGFTVESPSSSEDATILYLDRGVKLSSLATVLRGSASPSVTWTLRHSQDRNAAGTEVILSGSTTTNTSTGHIQSSLDYAHIPANSWVWLETSATGGTVDEFALCLVSVD